jgi:hypothetical protein
MDDQLPLPMWYLDVGIINPSGFYGVDGIVGLGQSMDLAYLKHELKH